jgi:23S rRNA pseudouridine1911/1915/1917 synthase
LSFEATAGDGGERLDRVLARRLPQYSRARFQAMIAAGHVRVNGEAVTEGRRKLKAGDHVTAEPPPPEETTIAAQALPLAIVHEDGHLIVIDKPAGLTVHPGAGARDGTLVNALVAHCGATLSGIGGVKRPGIVHRLDKDTTGLLVVAKTDTAHRALSKQFAAHGRDGKLSRAYLAIAWGALPRRQGVIEGAIGRKGTNRTKMAVVAEDKGRAAVTHYEVVETFGPKGKPVASLVRLHLETGRTHQIRVHLAHIGHPLLGDPVYGTGFRSSEVLLPPQVRGALANLNRQALHAAELGFEHPQTRKTMRFEAPIPQDFRAVLDALRLPAPSHVPQPLPLTKS